MHFLPLLLFLTSTTSALTISPFPTPTPPPTLQPRQDTSTLSSAPATTLAPVEYYTSTILNTIPGITNAQVTLPAKTITILIPTCSQTIVPDSNGYVPPGTCGALYDFYPSFAAAVVFSLLFGALTMGHIWLAAKWKAGYLWVLIMGVLWSTLGFTTRAISTKHQQSSGLALTSTIFTLLAPLWFNAHAYITFSHLLHTFHPSRRILNLSPRVLSTLFVSLDIGTFVIQIVGGSSASPASPPEDQKKGVDIYMGGIGIQQFFIVIFVLLAIKFQLEMSHFVKIGKVENWNKGKRLLWAIYACVGFITIRILFRLIQFNAGTSSANALVGQEAYFYVLEAVPMLFAGLTFIFIHPGGIVEKDVPGVGSLVKESCCCCKGKRRGGGKGVGAGMGSGWKGERVEEGLVGGRNGGRYVELEERRGSDESRERQGNGLPGYSAGNVRIGMRNGKL